MFVAWLIISMVCCSVGMRGVGVNCSGSDNMSCWCGVSSWLVKLWNFLFVIRV